MRGHGGCQRHGQRTLEPCDARQGGSSKPAVGLRLPDGMVVPDEPGAFKFARQTSKLAVTIRRSVFAPHVECPWENPVS